MTLVVTEVSEKYGCVVVGDTAVTKGNSVEFGARKVHYAADANIGFVIWGNACLAGRRLDREGVYVCGYQDGKPVLFHVHTGPELPKPQGPFQLYEDVPDASGGYHLRNGYYQMFAFLFDSMQQYAAGLRQLNFTWPESTVEDRVSYYTVMVETVARTLKAAGRVQAVGELVSAFAFNRAGILVDKRLPCIRMVDFCRDGGDMASFGEPG